MAVIAGERKAIPSANPVKPPHVTVGPQNVGLPGYRPGDPGVGYGASTGYVPPPAAPAAPPAAAAAAPAPPPLDFNAMALNDPEYTTGHAQLAAANTMTLKSLKDAFLRNTQSAQDSANAHGQLFSGAAANAQAGLADQYSNPINGALARQALNFDQGGSGLYFSVYNRLKNQIGQPLGVPQ